MQGASEQTAEQVHSGGKGGVRRCRPTADEGQLSHPSCHASQTEQPQGNGSLSQLVSMCDVYFTESMNSNCGVNDLISLLILFLLKVKGLNIYIRPLTMAQPVALLPSPCNVRRQRLAIF